MLLFYGILLGCVFIFCWVIPIAIYLMKPPRNWETEPWSTKDTVKTAIAVGMAAHLWEAHKNGDGPIKAWTDPKNS
jgi:hypothetical protein